MRAAARASGGMVATSQRYAAEAGRRVLAEGGSAADAAVAMAACLTVVEPCSNGLGSDAFAIVRDGGRLHGLAGAGRAPASLTLDAVLRRGHATMPLRSWETVTVPGAVAAWAALHERFGRLPFERLLADAVAYARDGFVVTPVVAAAWASATQAHRTLSGAEFEEWARVFAPGGSAPAAGSVWGSPAHAATLAAIAATRGEAFYRGPLADAVARFAAATGGYLDAADLAAHRTEWVEPLAAPFAGHTVHELPPSGQGVAVLEALTILDGLELTGDPAEVAHRSIEAVKLALTDAHAHVADPACVPVPTAGLLDPGYAATRRALIGASASDPAPGRPPGSDTVYLCAADADGQLVSFIQSNFHGFGSHIVVPGTGIALQNRGHGFSLDPGHPNVLAPGKRPFHTIIPGFLDSPDGLRGPFGVMGGHLQAQGHVQVLLAALVDGADPQEALDRPRWFWSAGRTVECEDPALVAPLRARGHDARAADAASFFGRGQIIWQTPAGDLVGGTDPRCDGAVLGL